MEREYTRSGEKQPVKQQTGFAGSCWRIQPERGICDMKIAIITGGISEVPGEKNM